MNGILTAAVVSLLVLIGPIVYLWRTRAQIVRLEREQEYES